MGQFHSSVLSLNKITHKHTTGEAVNICAAELPACSAAGMKSHMGVLLLLNNSIRVQQGGNLMRVTQLSHFITLSVQLGRNNEQHVSFPASSPGRIILQDL